MADDTAPRRFTLSAFRVALLLLVGLAGYTRASAPFRMDLVIDEMHHLESWRNRYRTGDVYPLFVERAERQGLLRGERLERFRAVYALGPIVQRGLIAIVDPQPPVFPVLAECIEAATRSSLLAARLPSAVASGLAVWLMFLLGRALGDRTLGLWLAALVAIGVQGQMYAGIARPYAMAQCAAALVLLVFVADLAADRPTPRRLLLAALAAQGVQWYAWPIAGPLVLVDLIRRRRGGATLGALARSCWWYVLLSVGLLAVLAVQLRNPTVTAQAGTRSAAEIWQAFALASPFAALDPLAPIPAGSALSPAGLLLALVVVPGLLALATGRPARLVRRDGAGLALPAVRLGLVLCLASVLAAQVLIGSAPRLLMSGIVVFVVAGGIGLRALVPSGNAGHVVAGMVLAVFLAIRLIRPEDQHARYFWTDTPYGPIARQIEAALEPGDTWTTFPYVWSNPLYRFADLPEPVLLLNEGDLERFLATLPGPGSSALVLTKPKYVNRYPVLREARWRADFRNGFVLVRIEPPPRQRPSPL